MKSEKLLVLAASAILLTGCGASSADSVSSSESSSSVVAVDPIDKLIEDLNSNNLTVTSPSYATIEYFDDYSVFYDYEAEYYTDSGIFFVPNVGYCVIDANKKVTIDVPADTKSKMSDLYLMPSTIGQMIKNLGSKAFDKPVDGVYNVKNSTLIIYLALFAGYSSYDAVNFTKATVTPKDGSYEFYVFKDNSDVREEWGLTEEDYPDDETTCAISNIGSTSANELYSYAETYVPTGLASGLTDEQKAVMKTYQGDDEIISKIAALSFTSSSFFEDAETEWHIMDYRIGDITTSFKKLVEDNGYEVTSDDSSPDAGNYGYIFEKGTKESDATTGEEWTASISRLSYAYVSHNWFAREDGMNYPSWSFPKGRMALAGLSASYMQPSVCKANWNAQTDASGAIIPQFAPSVAIDKTNYADEYGSMTLSMRFTSDDPSIVAEGKAYDKILEEAGWTGDGWQKISNYYSESTRQSAPDADGKYTQIYIAATQSDLSFSLTEVDPNASYDF